MIDSKEPAHLFGAMIAGTHPGKARYPYRSNAPKTQVTDDDELTRRFSGPISDKRHGNASD
ncbi:hypothetical protein [Marinibacterium sp. SX1]|uniref:hypothetical protein n=1 Tax=Marinibacterium sp. SX1 TaxID=3388424 RepID=UPI003D18328A